ncbi:MAG: hypothetical protein EXR33_02595, partial [Betaproteobacteria bacterium]|nr:hypothetical protein [Betaproteobacteria bacterium]
MSSAPGGHHAVDGRFARAAPEPPQALLGEAAHEAIVVAQALDEQRLVRHPAMIRDPDDRLGAPSGHGVPEGDHRLSSILRLRECNQRHAC